MAELWFDDPAAFQAALASPAGRAAMADLARFVDVDRTAMTLVSEVVAWPDPSAADEPASRAPRRRQADEAPPGPATA